MLKVTIPLIFSIGMRSSVYFFRCWKSLNADILVFVRKILKNEEISFRIAKFHNCRLVKIIHIFNKIQRFNMFSVHRLTMCHYTNLHKFINNVVLVRRIFSWFYISPVECLSAKDCERSTIQFRIWYNTNSVKSEPLCESFNLFTK